MTPATARAAAAVARLRSGREADRERAWRAGLVPLAGCSPAPSGAGCRASREAAGGWAT